MSINLDRPIITYENVVMLQGGMPAHSGLSNTAENLSFLPLVEGLNFSLDIPINNVGALGQKGFISQSNVIAPDVNLTINTVEDFGELFSGLFTGSRIRTDLNTDRNFYAYIGPERGFDASKKNKAKDVRYFAMESATNNAKFAAPYSGTIIYEGNLDGSSVIVKGGPYTKPTGVELSITEGKVYYGNKPIHAFGNASNHILVPFNLSGRSFGFKSSRGAPTKTFIAALQDNTTIEADITAAGVTSVNQQLGVINAGEIAFLNHSFDNKNYFIRSNQPVLCSKHSSNGQDRMLLAPAEPNIYKTKTEYSRSVDGGDVTTESANHAFSNAVQDGVTGCWANNDADSDGNDAVGHIGLSRLTKYQAFAAAEQNRRGDNTLHTDDPDWSVVAPYANTNVSIYYYENDSYVLWSGFTLNGTIQNPGFKKIAMDLTSLAGEGKNLFKMESTQPVAFFINDDSRDEEMLIGWNDEHLPENKSLGQFLSFGNCFLSNISTSQSINGLITSQYSYKASNLQAQQASSHDVGLNDQLYTGVSVPSLNLTGDQSQSLNTSISGIESYYSSPHESIIPHYGTNLTISGSQLTGTFLIKSDIIQGFNLNLPINRKSIYGLGKKYPVKRKALFPNECSFTFSNKVSNFELSESGSNLKDFLNLDQTYTLNISAQRLGGTDTFNFKISDAKLTSQSYNSSIGSELVADLGFSFELNKLRPIPNGDAQVISFDYNPSFDSKRTYTAGRTLNGKTVWEVSEGGVLYSITWDGAKWTHDEDNGAPGTINTIHTDDTVYPWRDLGGNLLSDFSNLVYD